MKKLEVGIIGGAGYTAGELIRLLLNHPETNINFVFSTSNAGNKLYKVHQDLIGSTEISFTSQINTEVDVLFLCLGHGNSTAFLEKNSFSENTRIIDLSNDFRLLADKNFHGKNFVYGLPELNKESITAAQISKKLADKSTLSSFTIELNPKTIVKFATFEPMIFPIAKSALLFIAALIEIVSSGNDVPNATRNNPIIHSLIPNSLAIFPALSIAKSAPPIVKANPANNKSEVFPQANFSFASSSFIPST
jgi:hypothetical protein